MKSRVIILCLFIPQFLFSQPTPSHRTFDQLLKKHVNSRGEVNYKGFISDSVTLNQYLNLLSKNPPASNWSREEEMAFWINAYNAFTIKLVIQYYPVKSIKEIGSKIQIPFVNTPWDVKFIKIGNEKMDLNKIEHEKLRRKFEDPRIHMALVCASKSCPQLLNEAFTAEKLENQLKNQTLTFLQDPSRNKISDSQLQLSQIFNWYQMDFNKNGGSVESFIRKWTGIKVKSGAKITYLEYDWGLNE